MSDIGLTHVALPAADLDRSIAFYAQYAALRPVHRRTHPERDEDVVWLSDGARPFVIVLIKSANPKPSLPPFAHLGVACPTRAEVDRLTALARAEGCLLAGPEDAGPPVGYWAFLRDPDGHTLELSYGQDVNGAVRHFTAGQAGATAP